MVSIFVSDHGAPPPHSYPHQRVSSPLLELLLTDELLGDCITQDLQIPTKWLFFLTEPSKFSWKNCYAWPNQHPLSKSSCTHHPFYCIYANLCHICFIFQEFLAANQYTASNTSQSGKLDMLCHFKLAIRKSPKTMKTNTALAYGRIWSGVMLHSNRWFSGLDCLK